MVDETMLDHRKMKPLPVPPHYERVEIGGRLTYQRMLEIAHWVLENEPYRRGFAQPSNHATWGALILLESWPNAEHDIWELFRDGLEKIIAGGLTDGVETTYEGVFFFGDASDAVAFKLVFG